MNKITQYIHRPNLTELGMGNTNDKYLVCPESEAKFFFPEGKETVVYDEGSDKIYTLYSKIENSEFRVKRLSEIFDNYQMDPGDELIFTRYEIDSSITIKVRINECGRIFLNQGKRENGRIKDFEIINLERFPGFNKNVPYDNSYTYMGKEHHLEISFSQNRPKRADSPQNTDFYTIKLDGKELESIKNSYYYLTIRKGIAILKLLPKYEMKVLLNYDTEDSAVNNLPNLQQIFYGAPGTGKSHEIKKETKGKSVIRTTFHPDSDYSTFVGAYKPTTIDEDVVNIIGKEAFPVKNADGSLRTEKKIIYEFVKQAFLKAYLGAWKNYSEGKTFPISIKVKSQIEFDAGLNHYTLLSVSDNSILHSREFDFDKTTVGKVWPTLWKNDLFSIPIGPQSGQSVEQAIASWIKNNFESCTKEDFEKGWEFLIKKIREDSSIVVKKDNGDGKSTQEYILKSLSDTNDKVRVKVEDAGKSKDSIKKYFEGNNARGNQLEAKIVELLNIYEGTFDEKWNQFKSDVNNGNVIKKELTYKPQYLIVEEINRGNCAQIFGDLFQLLDRSGNGYSEYPIEADTDMQAAIKNAFAEEDEYKLNSLNIDGVIDDYVSNYNHDSTLSEDVKEGRIMLLPPNLYIWATMNTSDQSLFPIDSAFKRRWDWQYMPIGYKNSSWIIELGDKQYSWVKFQKIINQKIYDVDNSEDKQLGDYFVNADRTGGKISADTLLNKILFYIWNDVCKDDPDQIFQWIENKQPKSIKFSDFFGTDRDKKLQGFMSFHKVPAIGESTNADSSDDKQDSEGTETGQIPAEDDNDINS